MEQKYLSCFKFYDEKGRRLSLFARVFNEGILEVFQWICNKKDMFNKKDARKIYEEYLEKGNFKDIVYKGKPIHPNLIAIPLPEEYSGPNYTFHNWAEKNFFKQINISFSVNIPTLIKIEGINGLMDSIKALYDAGEETTKPEDTKLN